MRTAYRVRAYPDPEQAATLLRTFGCVRVVWNRTLATRHARYQAEGKSTSYRESDAALTAMKKVPGLAWLNEVSSVPLQQTLRHQHKAFEAFFQKRARYPRFKSRRSTQSATYTRAAFRWRDGQLTLAKTSAPLRFVWSWPDIDPAALDPATVTVSRDPDGRWFVVLHAEAHNVCPAEPPDQLVAMAAEHAVRTAAEGRKFGLYLLVSTQRPQKIAENVLSQADNLVLMRLNSLADAAFAQAAFSFVPPSLIERSVIFRQGEALIAGKISPEPALLRFGARVSEEGGADVPATWAAAR